MAAKCVEEKCNANTFDDKCENQCKDHYKMEAKKNCKPDDQACMDKYRKMAMKCIEEKCNATFENATLDDQCEARCKNYYRDEALDNCQMDDQACLDQYRHMAVRCINAYCN